MSRHLTIRQSRVLRYLQDRDRAATVRDITAGLRMNRTDVMNTLRLLDGQGYVTSDYGTFPASFTITDEGRKALDAAREDDES